MSDRLSVGTVCTDCYTPALPGLPCPVCDHVGDKDARRRGVIEAMMKQPKMMPGNRRAAGPQQYEEDLESAIIDGARIIAKEGSLPEVVVSHGAVHDLDENSEKARRWPPGKVPQEPWSPED